MGHRQFYAAKASMMAWVKKLKEGDIFKDAYGTRYRVIQNDVEHERVDLERMSDDGDNTKYMASAWTHESFAKLALDRKFERVCINCKRTRKEHLKKAKCLFGPTSWA